MAEEVHLEDAPPFAERHHFDRAGAGDADLLTRYATAGGRFLVCPMCFDAKRLDQAGLLPNAELGGTIPMWRWIGDEGATTFSY